MIVNVRRTVSVAGSLPAGPQPGEDQRRPVIADHAVRLADRALALPFVERIDGDEAALAARTRRGRRGWSVMVSARALNIREPTFASSAQCGMRPQR